MSCRLKAIVFIVFILNRIQSWYFGFKFRPPFNDVQLVQNNFQPAVAGTLRLVVSKDRVSNRQLLQIFNRQYRKHDLPEKSHKRSNNSTSAVSMLVSRPVFTNNNNDQR